MNFFFKTVKDYLALYIIDHGFVRAVYPNFHSVGKKLYRSSQPSPKQLLSLKNRYGIRTIINLRGENGLSAFKLEKEACKKLNLNISRRDIGVYCTVFFTLYFICL